MRVMISQPMHGINENEIKKQRDYIAEKYIISKGYELVDTFFMEEAPDNTEHPSIYYLARALKELANADALIMAPGWQNARGCRIEYMIASEYGLYIKDLEKDRNDEIEDIKNLPVFVVVGNTYSGTVSGSNTGTYNFRCIYNSGNTYYFLCLTNLGNANWSTACSKSWTVTIQGKTVTAKIPTKDQLDIAQASRATGFGYWTSTPYDGGNAWYVYSDGDLYTYGTYNSYGAVPLAVISL